MDLVDLTSISVVLVYIIPVILYLLTGRIEHIKALIGLVSTTAISETLKHQFIKTASPRPRGASNCDLLCTDGDRSGKPGMPSSHSAQVAFFSSFYFTQTSNIFIKTGLILYAGAVMASRYIKRCHTIKQIVIGAALGLSLSWIVVRHL